MSWDEIEAVMEQKGFEETSTTYSGDKIVKMQFATRLIDVFLENKPVICCEFRYEDDELMCSFSSRCNLGLLSLSTVEFSLPFEGNRFDNFYNRIKKYSKILHDYDRNKD